MSQTVQRWVITHRGKHGLRTLAMPAQGRYTYDTEAAAQAALAELVANTDAARLAEVFGLPLEVRACKCYAGHHDPVRVYFDN